MQPPFVPGDQLVPVEVQVAELRRDLARLRAMHMGLVELVSGKLALDPAELEHHIQAAWAKLAAHDGFATAAPAAAAASTGHTERMQACSMCHAQVGVSRLTMLPTGAVCDACANR